MNSFLDEIVDELNRRDPYPRRLREHLERSRAQGLAFKEAWWLTQKIEHKLVWGKRTGPRSGEEESPLSFLKRHYEAAYNRSAPPQRQSTVTDTEWERMAA